MIFYIYDDKDQNVEIDEDELIDLSKVLSHLNLGRSVFITCKKKA